MILLRGDRPILVDTGFGGDVEETFDLLRGIGCAPQSLQLVVNTHYHCDHAGGNHALQTRYNIPIATHRWDANMVNSRDIEACSLNFLVQPMESYRVERPLSHDDELDTGSGVYRVLHTPGHTTGHIALYADGVLIAGDTIHADDVAWINPYREGANAIYQMLDTLDTLAKLPLECAYSGHGPANLNPLESLDRARRRYEKWITQPEKIGWHASKRIFTYALMLFDGLTQEEITPYLLGCPWFVDYSQHIFKTTPKSFVQPLIDELLRSGAASWQAGNLIPNAPYNHVDSVWMRRTMAPDEW